MMTEIRTADQLGEYAKRIGVNLEWIEADVLLGYLEGHDFTICQDEAGNLHLHDLQMGDNHSEDQLYSLKEAVCYMAEQNADLLDKAAVGSHYRSELAKDEYILDRLFDKLSDAAKPVEDATGGSVAEYEVVITETLEKVVTVEAESMEDALHKAEKDWDAGDYILDADSFAGVEFRIRV